MAKTVELPSKQELESILDANFETGELTWKHRPKSDFNRPVDYGRWASRKAGKPAFNSASSSGYLHGRVGMTIFRTHRVLWKMFTGSDPLEIDHINRIKTDNRICNLRSVTRSENLSNRRPFKIAAK